MTSPKFFDSHCHPQLAVDFGDRAPSADEITDSALAADTWFVAVGVDRDSSAQAVSLAERYPTGVYAAVGRHPDEMESPESERSASAGGLFDENFYSRLAASSKTVAVGECGLDFYRLPSGDAAAPIITRQKELFRRQLDFAASRDLPVILHCRQAHTELLIELYDFIARKKPSCRGVIHSFTAGQREAAAYLELGFCIGLNGIITFPPKKGREREHEELLEVSRRVPENMFLLETDAPWLAPVPERGGRNRPEHVRFVAEKMAEIRGVTPTEIAAKSVANARRLFSKIS